MVYPSQRVIGFTTASDKALPIGPHIITHAAVSVRGTVSGSASRAVVIELGTPRRSVSRTHFRKAPRTSTSEIWIRSARSGRCRRIGALHPLRHVSVDVPNLFAVGQCVSSFGIGLATFCRCAVIRTVVVDANVTDPKATDPSGAARPVHRQGLGIAHDRGPLIVRHQRVLRTERRASGHRIVFRDADPRYTRRSGRGVSG